MGSTIASFDVSVKTLSILIYEGYLRCQLFGNYTLFVRKDFRALEVLDDTSSNTILQLNYRKEIEKLSAVMTKDKMTAVAEIEDKDS